jgi:hypothetical protein
MFVEGERNGVLPALRISERWQHAVSNPCSIVFQAPSGGTWGPNIFPYKFLLSIWYLGQQIYEKHRNLENEP